MRSPLWIVLARTLRDQRRALIGFSIGLALYSVMIAGFWPTVRDQQEQFEKLIEAYPAAVKEMFGIEDLATAPGFVHAEMFGTMVPLLLLVYAIGRAADLVAGEEERGTLDLLLAHPVSRRRAFLGKAAGLGVGLAMLGAVLWASLALLSVAFGMGIRPLDLAAETMLAVLLAAAIGGLTFLVAGLKGRKGLAVASGSAIAVATFLLHGLGGLVDALGTVRKASPFYYYSESPPLTAGFEPLYALVLAALAGVALAGAV